MGGRNTGPAAEAWARRYAARLAAFRAAGGPQLPVKQAARMFGVDRRTVTRWRKAQMGAAGDFPAPAAPRERNRRIATDD
jgi:transposase-like protein